jgi:hypothetical protein
MKVDKFTVSFDTWPELVLNIIAQFLDIHSLISCLITCKKFSIAIRSIPTPLIQSTTIITRAIEDIYNTSDKPVVQPCTTSKFTSDLYDRLTGYLRTCQITNLAPFEFLSYYHEQGTSIAITNARLKITNDKNITLKYYTTCDHYTNNKEHNIYIYLHSTKFENLVHYSQSSDRKNIELEKIQKIIIQLKLQDSFTEFITKLLEWIDVPTDVIQTVIQGSNLDHVCSENYIVVKDRICDQADQVVEEIKAKYKFNIHIAEALLPFVKSCHSHYILQDCSKHGT